jgi:hypothetical protein
MDDRVVLSQRTVVQVKRVLDALMAMKNDMREVLYEQGMPDWFVRQVNQRYAWNWIEALWDLRSGAFFNRSQSYSYLSEESDSIVPEGLFSHFHPPDLGEILIRKLAAVCVVLLPSLPSSFYNQAQSLPRLLQLDGFDVDKVNVRLVPLEGAVSAKQEEDHLTKLVKASGVPASDVVLKHIEDASTLFAEGKDHPSLNESRSLIQVLIDGISTETKAQGNHTSKLPGGTGNRIKYLKEVGFFTADDEAAYGAGWGTLSAGSHPGIPDREQARIGLVLALEFGQLLLLKFTNWKANAYRSFS